MENEIRKRYGKLTVIEKLDRRKHNTSVYLCINVTGANLKKLISIIFNPSILEASLIVGKIIILL